MRFHLLFVFLFLSLKVSAQVDPTTGLLLKSSGSAQNLDSSRYELKPRDTMSTPVRVERTKVKPEVETKSEPPKATPKTEFQAKPTPTPDVKAEATNETESENDNTTKNAIHISDPRLNLVELEVAPGLIYLDSSSRSWYRNYFGTSPVIGINAKVWLTPNLGFTTGYSTSLAGDVTKSPGESAKISADLRTFSGGMIFRSYSSGSRLAPSQMMNVGYEEDQLLVPRTEPDRIRLKSSSFVVGLTARMPTQLSHAYRLSVELAPRIGVKEESTQATQTSGKLKSSNGVRVSFESEYIISRGQQLFWRISHRFDKSVYEGSTSGNDPITGGTLDGVSVQRGITLFQVGFTWGD